VKKKLLIAVPAVVALGLLFPLSNLALKPAPGGKLASTRAGDPAFARAAAALEARCAVCHVEGSALPFYASIPVASSLIRTDVAGALDHFNMVERLAPGDGKPATEVGLAELQYSVEKGTMPPGRFLALHWDGGLNRGEKGDVLAWIRAERLKHYATPGYPPEVQSRILQPLPASIPTDPARVALGNKLYHDKRLSGDDTVSCATCHDLALGGTDRLRFSRGIKGAEGDINAPTTFNSAFLVRQFWDGRAADLEEQAGGPPLNPIEMGTTWPQVIGKLEKDEAFVKEFRAVYPDGLSGKNIQNAIAEYEKTLVTPNSRFDRFLAGDAAALTDEEKKGHDLFLDRGCATCHTGKALGGQSFEKMGRIRDYFAERGGVKKPDHGRFNFTRKEKDRFTFKVPTLRNVALTAPYFHDGSQANLKDAVKIMGRVQTEDGLSDAEADRVTAFLGSLTGEYRGKLLR
jgi:cytochrome c peroxidase